MSLGTTWKRKEEEERREKENILGPRSFNSSFREALFSFVRPRRAVVQKRSIHSPARFSLFTRVFKVDHKGRRRRLKPKHYKDRS